MPPQKSRYITHLVTVTFTLFLITASRLLLLANLSFDHDEVRSIWRTFGTPQDIVARTPFDWPPGYYLSLGVWRLLVGIHPIVLRMSSVMLFMIGVALIYQLARRLFYDRRAAGLTMLAYAGLGYVVYLSVLLRGYAMVMALLPLGLLLVMNYFERPSLRHGLFLGLLVAGMFYVTLSAVFAYLVFGVFSLLLYPRQIWRWWLPGLVAFGVGLPEILGKIGMVAARTSVEMDSWLSLPPLPQAYLGIYHDYLGTAAGMWAIVLLLASMLIIFTRKHLGKSRAILITILLATWLVLGPVLLYVIDSRTNFFAPRYSWWIAPGIALWIGFGLSRLPKRASLLAGIGLIALLFVPQDIASYKEPGPVFEQNFAWLADHYQPGDVVLKDPNCYCGRAVQWDYYMNVYFQNDVELIDAPSDDYQRIWYVRDIGGEDEAMFNAVQHRRAPGRFTGEENFFFQLYTLPPDIDGVVFENGLRFHGAEVLDEDGIETAQILRPEGSELRVRLWWSVDRPLTQEYSVSLQAINQRTGALLSQADGAPQAIHLNPANPSPLPNTLADWQPGIFYLEERTLTIPFNISKDTFTVYLTVYRVEDGVRLFAKGVNEANLLSVFDFGVAAW